MTPAARLAAAIEALAAIEQDNRPADRVLSSYLRARRYIGAKDRHAISHQVYAVLRRRARIDWTIMTAGNGLPLDARSRALTSLAFDGAAAIVIEPADDDRHAPPALDRRERQFVAGVAAGAAAEQADNVPDFVRLECPEWILPMLRADLGADVADAVLDGLRGEAAMDLRVSTSKVPRSRIRTVLGRAGIEVMPTALSPRGLRAEERRPIDGLPAFKAGHFEVQDEGSQIAAALVGAAPGMQVVDFCAGAGGKTLAMAETMANKGRILAVDISANRIKRLSQRLKRAGYDNVEPRLIEHERDRSLKSGKRKFDRVLVDAPCTGTGTWRRNPDARWRYGPSDLQEITVRQGSILEAAARMVKPGGRLVYVTCSILAAENEAVVAAFQNYHEDFEIVPIAEVWAETLGVDGVECPTVQPMLRLSPDRHGTDGFFVAVLQQRDKPPS